MAVTESGHLASREVDDLYRRHGAEVYRYAYAVLGNHADAEDVTQTTFLNAYRSLAQGVRPRKPANWLLTIASNAIKQRFRQEQARPRLVELDERLAGYEAEENDGPSVGELLTALSKIPPQQRQAIVLREFEGRSYTEIAEILGVTTSALETLLFRARRSLAEELEHQLTCTEAQLAISKSVDDRLGRKERRRLKDHLTECPDCAHFARLQQRHSRALRGLMLIPIPLSLSIFKGLEGAGTASAATVPVAAGASTVAAGVGVGAGTSAATGGGIFAGGVAVKAAAAVAAVTVAGGAAVTGVSEISKSDKQKQPPAATKPGQRLGQVAPRGVLVPGNGVARGKATAPGQLKGSTAHKSGMSQATRTKKNSRPTKPATAATGKRVAGARRQNTPKSSTEPKTSSSRPTTSGSSRSTATAPAASSGGNDGGNGAGNGSAEKTSKATRSSTSTDSKPANEKASARNQ